MNTSFWTDFTPRVVLFDLSGTIIDSLKLGDRAVLDEICEKYAGEPYLSLRRLKDHNASIRRNFTNFFGERAQEAYHEYIGKLTQALPLSKMFEHVDHMLGRLSSEGVMTGLITNRCRYYTEAALRHYGIGTLFNRVVTGDNERGLEKPNPGIIDLMLEELGMEDVPRGDVLLIGDSYLDIQCADRAGVRAALFSDRELGTPEVQARLQDPEKMPVILIADYSIFARQTALENAAYELA